jgi:hypothetical protein
MSQPLSSPQHESNADQKSRAMSLRNVQFIEKSVQMPSGLVLTEEIGTPVNH